MQSRFSFGVGSLVTYVSTALTTANAGLPTGVVESRRKELHRLDQVLESASQDLEDLIADVAMV